MASAQPIPAPQYIGGPFDGREFVFPVDTATYVVHQGDTAPGGDQGYYVFSQQATKGREHWGFWYRCGAPEAPGPPPPNPPNDDNEGWKNG